MTNLQEFFAMGGHGLYVWLSYGLSFFVIALLIWRLRAARRGFMRQARARSQRLSTPPQSEIQQQDEASIRG